MSKRFKEDGTCIEHGIRPWCCACFDLTLHDRQRQDELRGRLDNIAGALYADPKWTAGAEEAVVAAMYLITAIDKEVAKHETEPE